MTHLPNALIIGVQKSATTWIATRLSQHPDVFMVPGEVHYFDNDKNYNDGIDWYSNHFRGVTTERVICEKSGAYFWTACDDYPSEPQDKPERIKELIPDARLILVLRDPVKRAISGWNHNVRSGQIPVDASIENLMHPDLTSLVAKHGILTRGLYYRQLIRYYKVFPKSQILVLFQETDVIADPLRGLRKLCHFLEIDESFNFSEIDKAENQYEATRVGTTLAARSPEMLTGLALRVDRSLLTRLPLARLEYPRPSSSLISALADYYADDCALLASELGPLPENWINSSVNKSIKV